MADDTVITQEAAVDPQVAAKAELDQLMNRNLGIGVPGQQAQPVIQTANNEAAVQEAVIEQPTFSFDTFKTEFGYEKPEDIVAEIKQLREFKATPQTPAELKFENEQSKQLFEALKAGKTAEVRAFLVEQNKLENLSSIEVNDTSAEDIIKAGMGLRYKGLTDAEINYKFNKQFGIPKEPVIKADEEPEDFDQRKAEWKSRVEEIKMERMIEAKTFKPEIESAKAKLVIPEIPQTVDQNYQNWKQEQEEMKTVDAETIEAYKTFKREDVNFEQDFIDEANKINTKIQYTPTIEGFQKAQKWATDIDSFYGEFKKPDGSPDRKGFITFLAMYADRKDLITSTATQVKNATIKASLPDNQQQDRNQRQILPLVEKSELDKQMEAAGIRRN